MRSVRSRRRCDGCVARVRCAAQQRQAKSRAHDIFARGVGALHGSWKPTSKMASAQRGARAVKHDGEQQGKGRVDREQDETRIFPVRNNRKCRDFRLHGVPLPHRLRQARAPHMLGLTRIGAYRRDRLGELRLACESWPLPSKSQHLVTVSSSRAFP